MKKIKTALISVSEKKKLNKLLKSLSKHKIQIISSGGTFKKNRSPLNNFPKKPQVHFS